MPYKRRRFGTRRPRARTRWLAIVPGSSSNNTNNTGSRDELVIRDLEGNVQFNDFVGGTLLRVVLVLQHEDSVAFSAFARGSATDHHGIYLTADESPSSTAGAIWDPNIPSGSFMTRWSNSREYWGISTQLTAKESADSSQHGQNFMSAVDTEVKRRIRENDRLWLGHWHFEDATVVTGTAYGWTGRVLIQLP